MKSRILGLAAPLTAVALLAAAPAASATSYIVLGGNGKAFDRALSRAGGVAVERISAVGATLVESDDPAFARKIGRVAGVQYVMPNVVLNFRGGEERPSQHAQVEYDNPPSSGDDDFYFDRQWGHDAVDAPEAWNAGFRGAGAKVAVLDGGFSLAHPDIATQYDPSCTADFTGEGIEYGPNSDDPDGIFAHGMHTAGTIAAADNAFGTIGVAPEATLCLVKVLFNFGSGSFFDIAQGIVFSADNGVDIINMSLGTVINKSGSEEDGYTARDAAGFRVFVNQVVAYAYKKGVLVITSAGNDAENGDKDKNLVHLPSDAPHAVSVSATAPIGWGADSTAFLDNLASYSNYGRSVISVAAPGGDFLYAFDPAGFDACTVAGATRVCYVWDFVFSTGAVAGASAYWYWSAGTSMAAPHAAGVAALAVSAHGRMHPAQLRAILERSADDLGQPGNDPAYGAGRVNAYNAVMD